VGILLTAAGGAGCYSSIKPYEAPTLAIADNDSAAVMAALRDHARAQGWSIISADEHELQAISPPEGEAVQTRQRWIFEVRDGRLAARATLEARLDDQDPESWASSPDHFVCADYSYFSERLHLEQIAARVPSAMGAPGTADAVPASALARASGSRTP